VNRLRPPVPVSLRAFARWLREDFHYVGEVRLARGRLRVAQGRAEDGLDDFLAVGTRLTRALITCPSYLPWRSEAALVQRALGGERGGRAHHEVANEPRT
jgi:hypothetical protein